MDTLKISPYEVYINYSWSESLSIKKIGGDDTYTEYESYYYSILEDGKELLLKNFFDKYRATPQDPLEMEGIDYFLQFIPPSIHRRWSGIDGSRPSIQEQNKAVYLTQRLNEKYSIENRKLFDSLKLTNTYFSNLNKDELASIKEFLKENYHDDVYNNISLLDNPNPRLNGYSNLIIYIIPV